MESMPQSSSRKNGALAASRATDGRKARIAL